MATGITIQKNFRNAIGVSCFIFFGCQSLLAQHESSTVAKINAYITSFDSLFSHFEEIEQDRMTIAGIITKGPQDTSEKMILENIIGDTVYRIQYHDYTDKELYEIYYLENNIPIAAKIELRDTGEHVLSQKTTYYDNGKEFFKDSTTGLVKSRNYKHMADLLSYKKEQLLAITKKYLPDNYDVLAKYHFTTINFMAHGDSIKDYFVNYPTIMHEGFHTYELSLNANPDDPLRHYRLNDTLIVSIKKFNSFPANKLVNFAPYPLKDKSRYDGYINSPDTLSATQADGFFGLLEEYAAYFEGLKACVVSFDYLRDRFKFKDPALWLNYLNNSGSDVYAINEFRIFISWYLQYSRLHEPALFKMLTQDRDIQKLFTHIENRSRLLVDRYLKNRAIILNYFKEYIQKEDAKRKMKREKKLTFYTDMFTERLLLTGRLLMEPQHKILNLLRL